MTYNQILELIEKENENLLTHQCKTVSKELLHLPSADVVNEVYALSNRNIPTLCNLNKIFNYGRLAGTGYLSILPIDQGVEHSAGASFAINPLYFDPRKYR